MASQVVERVLDAIVDLGISFTTWQNVIRWNEKLDFREISLQSKFFPAKIPFSAKISFSKIQKNSGKNYFANE
jgi:hypothetical protein